MSRRVFISRVSRELGSYAEELRNALQRVEIASRTQLSFRQESDTETTLEKLSKYIVDSDTVLCLIGSYSGGYPADAAMDTPIFPVPPDDRPERTWRQLIPEGFSRLSYTQWEYVLARFWQKAVFLYHANGHRPDQTPHDSRVDDLPQQQEFVQWAFRSFSRDWDTFQNPDRLCRDALCTLWPPTDRDPDVRAVIDRYEQKLDALLAGQQRIKGELDGTRTKILQIAAVIMVGLLAISAGTFLTLREAGATKEWQTKLTEQLEIQHQTTRVITAYQQRFREIRDDPNQEATLPNVLIDKMVREELPGIVGLKEVIVTRILEIEAPKLAADRSTPINLKLAALFAIGEYDATLEQGKKLLVEPTIEGLKTMGDAVLGKFEKQPAKELREEAIRYYRGSQALIDREEQPEQWASASMLLANTLREVGAYDEAESLNRAAIKARSQVFGREHPSTLILINNLAGLLGLKGDFKAAEPLHRETVAAFTQNFGREDPATLSFISNQASCLQALGDYDAAESLHREVMEARAKVLGREHPDTLISINNLALILLLKEDYEAAAPLFRQAVEARTRISGSEHPVTLSFISNQASCLQAMDDYDAAERLNREVMEARVKILGREHPDTLTSINNYAFSLKSQKNYKAAEPLYRDTLAARTRVLGRGHPETLGSINNLAILLEAKKDYAAAEPLYRELVEAHGNTLGREHPETLRSIQGLAQVLFRLDNFQAAIPLGREVMEGRTRILGREHPDTQSSILMLAVLLLLNDDCKAAERLFYEAYQGLIKKSGENHPDTKLVKLYWEGSKIKLEAQNQELAPEE